MTPKDAIDTLEKKIKRNHFLSILIHFVGFLSLILLGAFLLLYISLKVAIAFLILGSLILGLVYYTKGSCSNARLEACHILDGSLQAKERFLTLDELVRETTDDIKFSHVSYIAKQVESKLVNTDLKELANFKIKKREKIFCAAILLVVLVIAALSSFAPPKIFADKVPLSSEKLSALVEQSKYLPESLKKSIEELLKIAQKDDLNPRELESALKDAETELKKAKSEHALSTVSKASKVIQATGTEDSVKKESSQFTNTPTPSPSPTPSSKVQNNVTPPPQEEKKEEDKETDIQNSESTKDQKGKDGKQEKQAEEGGQSEESQNSKDGDGSKDGEKGEGKGDKKGQSSQESQQEGGQGKGESKKDSNKGSNGEGQKDSSQSDQKSQHDNSKSEELNQAEQALNELKQDLEKNSKEGEGNNSQSQKDSQDKQEKSGQGKEKKEGEKPEGSESSQKSKQPKDSGDNKSAKDREKEPGDKPDSQGKPDENNETDGSDKKQQDQDKGSESSKGSSTQSDKQPKQEKDLDDDFSSEARPPTGIPPKSEVKEMGEEDGPKGEGLGENKGFEDVAVQPQGEDLDTSQVGKEEDIVKNKEKAEPKIKLSDVQLAKPDPEGEKGEQRIPLEYRDMLR